MFFRNDDLFKKILIGSAALFLAAEFLFPAAAALAQIVTIEDPGLTPPFDANVESCTNIMYQTLNPGTLTPNIPRKTDAEIRQEYLECFSIKYQKQTEWWYRRAQYMKNQWGMRVMTALYGGLIDAMSMISQRIAYEAASDLLSGNPGNEPRFWNSDFGTWLDNSTLDASSKFIDRLDVVVGDWTQSTTAQIDPITGKVVPGTGVRFSFCSPPDAYTLKMSLGIGEAARIGPGACNYKKIADNFEAIGELISSGEALQVHRPSVTYGASDLSVGVETNSTYFNYLLNERAGNTLARQEDKGLRPVMDVVSGRIKIPTVLAENSYQQLSPITMGLKTEQEQRSAILSAYWQAGLENIPILALTTFSNTLIVGLLHKWLDPNISSTGDGVASPDQINITFESLQNADATGDTQDLYERKAFAKALGDYLVPNFSTNEDQDIIMELTTCNTPRKRFNCAMDQTLGVAINVGTKEGALTVGRAAGVGSEGAIFGVSSRALHADWEMIPENDLKNNTDPTCAQRAYCAGNLKKMRLARIIPVGWEMAANSPYNLKNGGKYITLGEVINGFYDCNDQGVIDKDHPWCHLIDPNWILTAPKYQCRAQGFGDAILPEVGTRLEDCGDMVSCLKSDQNGQCIGGYGYCLAEKPVWRFDAQECKEQFVSCRTYAYSGGQISLLRNTEDKGKCSEENIGCTWYSTERYPYPAVTDNSLVDGLWVGTVTSGPRVYMDGGAETCSSEGCTKMLAVPQSTSTSTAQSALNLVQNGSFEEEVKDTNGNFNGFFAWTFKKSGCAQFSELAGSISSEANDGNSSLLMKFAGANCDWPDTTEQVVQVEAGRNYVFSLYTKHAESSSIVQPLAALSFWSEKADGSFTQIDTAPSSYSVGGAKCEWWAPQKELNLHAQHVNSWQRNGCQFVTPPGTSRVLVKLSRGVQTGINIDSVQLEEGEVTTPFVDGIASDLKATYLKIAPDEYKCTGDDSVDHPGCQRFARVCRQIDVGCQGYRDVEDLSAPEVPAILSTKDLCPAICSGYGEYRKLASAFDLVKDPAHPEFDDADDETTAYFIPNLADKCSLENVGCEPFTSMEAAVSTGESVSFYKDVRLCQKPNDYSATYYTWEGSEVSGYQLKTWSLIADTDDVTKVASSAPKLIKRGSTLGHIKDPATCNAVNWNLKTDLDCRQFYDVQGSVYYVYYSQTVSSDLACTTYRKDEVTEADCTKTGGSEFAAASGSCIYNVLPTESLICSADAGGCRAYMGPTGRNAINIFRDTFATGTQVVFDTQQGGNVTLQYSTESVLVGDRSLKMQAPAGSSIRATLKLALGSSTSSLMRISFWAKSNNPKSSSDSPSQILVDGVEVGIFYPDVNWSRFEVGPFNVKDNPTLIEIVVPSKAGQPSDNIVYLDTFSVDQLNDVQFVRKNRWSIPLACDSTPEGTPEPRYMVGCREYSDRNSNQVFASNFSRLCRDTAIGCSAFIDTDDKTQPYAETKTVKGTALPQNFDQPDYAKHGDAKAYEEQFFGDWSMTSRGYRYYYAINDERGRCDSSEASCRAYGQPIFSQNRIQLVSTDYKVNPNDEVIYENQKQLYGFATVLLKDGWDKLLNENNEPNLACRKDELFCDKFKSGNITEYFRDPKNQTCVWAQAKHLAQNLDANIPSEGDYSGWFREGTDIPCYPSYLSSGNTYLIEYSGENDYAGWGGKCPVDQSECTALIDPNDTSDAMHPSGKPYYVINGPKLDKSSCGGTADPLSGCVLFRDVGVGTVEANSQATYAKVTAERGAAQTPINCEGDPENEYCKQVKAGKCESTDLLYQGKACVNNADCGSGICQFNDSNIVLKVRMDRECSKWMGCRTGETIYDATQQKFVTQCTQRELCQQNGLRDEDVYCMQITDRSKEDFLKVGQFASPENYSARTVGFGKADYSGFVVPNGYLVPDITVRQVGTDLKVSDKLNASYRNDLRLVAGLPVDGKIIKKVTDPNFSHFLLCQDTRTGRYGYLTNTNSLCYLPISETGSLQLVAGQQSNETSRDIQRVYEEFTKDNVGVDNGNLQSAMPLPECQIYPEETSPLTNDYVAEWNSKVNPPVPVRMIDGFENGKACVAGEDCSCSYRKVRYTGSELYYSVDGDPPAVGVCLGGERDGQACVPGGYVAVDAKNQVIARPPTGDTCKGGVCQSIQDVVFVYGQYGYCLERDLTRVGVANQTSAPCLTWNPLNVFGGKYDTTHRAPTAGYMPAQGAGEYYCVSGANQQRLITPSTKSIMQLNNGGWTTKDFWVPGKMSQFAYSRSDVWWTPYEDDYVNYSIEGKSNRMFGQSKSVLDQLKTEEGQMLVGTQMGNMPFACRRASLCEGFSMVSGEDRVSGGLDANETEGRWITTGDGIASSYMEYFVPSAGIDELDDKFFDYRYGLFKFSIPPYAAGSACKWNPHWAGLDYPKVEAREGSDFSCQEYLSRIQSTSQQFLQTFNQNFNGILDRGSEKMLADAQDKPMKIGCAISAGNNCYYKYWETGYQNNGQEAFRWIGEDEKVAKDFNFKARYSGYYSRECRAGQPYFGIRAVFQNVNPVENALPPEEARTRRLSGPYQFVGFWFTTCLPTQYTNDPGWMYMRLDEVKVDVCREVGQVISPEARENAAFTDRIWNSGMFTLPELGLQYITPNAPFGSAVAASKIGRDPLIMGTSVPGASDSGNVPTFVDSGVSVAPLFSRQSAWVPLTNLFARVYKIWRWEDTLVMPYDWMCMQGVNTGKLCKADSNKYEALKTCSDYASCDPDIDKETLNQNWRCNSLSGVNRGLHCGDSDFPARNADPLCHNAALSYKWNQDTLQADLNPLLTTCRQSNVAAFSVPLDLYGYCEVGNASGVIFDFTCGVDGAVTDLDSLMNSNDRMTFNVKKCTSGTLKGQYFLDPSVNVPLASGIENSGGNKTKLHMWYVAYKKMKALIAQSVTLDIGVSGGYKCDMVGRMNGSVKETVFDEGYMASTFAFWPKNSTLVHTGIANNGKGIDNLYGGGNHTGMDYLYNKFELGFWDNDRMEMIRDNRCGVAAVNAGERCGPASDKSAECPMKVVAYNTQEYKTLNQARKNEACNGSNAINCQSSLFPPDMPYGRCSVNDPATDAEDQYKETYPGTGYCVGFNPLSRCKEDTDCVFTEFEFWGKHDDGTGQGKNWNDAVTPIVQTVQQERSGQGFQTDEKNVRLPLPLFEDGGKKQTTVPKIYSEPAMLVNFANNLHKVGDSYASTMARCFEQSAVNQFCYDTNFVATECPIQHWEAICKTMAPPPDTPVGTWPLNFGYLVKVRTLWVSCEASCRAAALLMPNTYAHYFPQTYYQTANKRLRTAAVAPFAVNPLHRVLNSLSVFQLYPHEGGDPVANSEQYYDYIGWIMKKFYVFSFSNFVGLDITTPIAEQIKGEDLKIDANGADYLAKFIGWSGKGITERLKDTYDFFGYPNDSLPWNPERLYFTNVFPLLTHEYGAPRMLQHNVMGQEIRPGYGRYDWEQFTKVWFGFGMSDKLFQALDNEIAAYNNGDVAGGLNVVINGSEVKSDVAGWIPQNDKGRTADYEFQKQVHNDMQEEFFNKTGWGTFMQPDNDALKLYPGAIAAAVPRDDDTTDNVLPDDKLNVFIPGHCEPPAGGTDADTIVGIPSNVILTKYFGPIATWNQDWSAPFTNPWESFEASYTDKPLWRVKVGTEVELGIDLYQEAWMKKDEWHQWTEGERQRHEFIEPQVMPKPGVDPRSVAMEGPLAIGDLRTTCRCEGGILNGTVQESQADCNIGLPDDENPDKLSNAERYLSGDEWCRNVADLSGEVWVPTAECQATTGVRGDLDPDKDDNSCTHNVGYIPRGDVCQDGREQCLTTYKLNDPESTDHKSLLPSKSPAASATDVTFGLDSYLYLSGDRVERDARQYTSWYRPLPPRIAAPDATRSGSSANSLEITKLDAFSLDGLVEGMIFHGLGQGLSTIRFYAWAAHDQSPLKSYVIDWGDGTVQTISDAQMKNQKPVCGSDRECSLAPGLSCTGDGDCPPGTGQCLSTGYCKKQSNLRCSEDDDCGANDACQKRVLFGNSNDACRQGYFEFQHIYKCTSPTDIKNQTGVFTCGATQKRCANEPNITCNSSLDCKSGEACVEGLAPRGGCYDVTLNRCRFTPRVMLIDNWGWCTGNCRQPNEASPGNTTNTYPIRHPNGGCWDGSDTKFNVDVKNNPKKSATLPNECKIDGYNTKYRPWIIFGGSVELSLPLSQKLLIEEDITNGGFNQFSVTQILGTDDELFSKSINGKIEVIQ